MSIVNLMVDHCVRTIYVVYINAMTLFLFDNGLFTFNGSLFGFFVDW